MLQAMNTGHDGSLTTPCEFAAGCHFPLGNDVLDGGNGFAYTGYPTADRLCY